MEKNESKEHEEIVRRLDVISIFLLSQKGLTQREIGKILGVSGDKIRNIFGKNYAKIIPQESKKKIK